MKERVCELGLKGWERRGVQDTLGREAGVHKDKDVQLLFRVHERQEWEMRLGREFWADHNGI